MSHDKIARFLIVENESSHFRLLASDKTFIGEHVAEDAHTFFAARTSKLISAQFGHAIELVSPAMWLKLNNLLLDTSSINVGLLHVDFTRLLLAGRLCCEMVNMSSPQGNRWLR